MWDKREPAASSLSRLRRGCIHPQVLSAIPKLVRFPNSQGGEPDYTLPNMNVIQLWIEGLKKRKLKSELFTADAFNFESEQALPMRMKVTIWVNWQFKRLRRIILPDWKMNWIDVNKYQYFLLAENKLMIWSFNFLFLGGLASRTRSSGEMCSQSSLLCQISDAKQQKDISDANDQGVHKGVGREQHGGRGGPDIQYN